MSRFTLVLPLLLLSLNLFASEATKLSDFNGEYTLNTQASPGCIEQSIKLNGDDEKKVLSTFVVSFGAYGEDFKNINGGTMRLDDPYSNGFQRNTLSGNTVKSKVLAAFMVFPYYTVSSFTLTKGMAYDLEVKRDEDIPTNALHTLCRFNRVK